MSDEDLLAELEQRMLNCHSEARELRKRRSSTKSIATT